jgi:hypothetical protein
MHFHAYGAVIRTNFSCPGLLSARSCADTTAIQVDRVDKLPPAAPSAEGRSLQGRRIQVAGTFPDICFRIDELLLIAFEQQLRRIHCYAAHGATDASVNYWLLRHALPAARFLWEEVEVLHAGAVEIQGATTAFLAPCGAGKSTLVGYFVGRGYKLIADDHLLLQPRDEGFVTSFPSIPFYRDNRDPEYLGRETRVYDNTPRPLRTLYVLHPVAAQAEVVASPLNHSVAAVELLRQAPFNVRMFGFRIPSVLSRQRMDSLVKVAQATSVRRLDVPQSLDRLPEVFGLVIREAARATSRTVAAGCM